MKNLIAIILFTLSIGSSYAQIGIGIPVPDASAVLEVSTTNKGFLPPRVANVGAIATPVAGLIIYDVSEQCIKYHNGTDWSGCLSDGTLTAVAGTVDCGSLAVNGAYKPGFDITASETVTLNVDFTVAGAWSASTDLVNGYAFVGSGTVASTGVQPITLNAMGIPIAAQTDAFVLTFNNPTQTCNFNVTVLAGAGTVEVLAVAGTVDCGSLAVNGTYKSGSVITASETVTLNVDFTVAGAWSASTDLVNGYAFVGSGTVASTGVQPVTLNAMGIPAAAQTDAFTLTFNNPTQTCSFNVTVSAAAAAACGAYVTAGVYKAFMCHNLGADTNLDPNVPVQGIHGNYYQWGRSTVVADAYTPVGVIAGWNTIAAPNGSWTDASKTANDPCPAGFRVPTRAQWNGVIANNTVSRTGSWTNNNFTTTIHWGPDASTKTLTLPAAGYRGFTNGSLSGRGINGVYWSSTENGTFAGYLYFDSSSVDSYLSSRANGFSVRCVSE